MGKMNWKRFDKRLSEARHAHNREALFIDCPELGERIAARDNQPTFAKRLNRAIDAETFRQELRSRKPNTSK